MEDTNNNNNYDSLYDVVEEDTLSFCNFYNDDDEYDNYSSPRKYPDTPDSFFEFLIDPDLDSQELGPTATIVFCGKTLSNNPPTKQPKLVQRDPRNGLFLFKTNSFKKSHSFRSDHPSAKSASFSKTTRSNSLRFRTASKPSAVSPATAGCRYQTSKSSRKHKMVLIGSLSKPQPRMELSDIKKRQGRLRAPKPLFPVAEGSELAVDGGSGSGGHNHHHWSLLRPLRCRAHLVSALVKASFGCIPSPRPVV